jgi:predicted transcriptional regulator
MTGADGRDHHAADVKAITPGNGRPKIDPASQLKLIDDLALGLRTQNDLAEEYGVSQAAISKFVRRHRQAIARVRQTIREGRTEALAGLWISEQRARIQWFQDEVERLRDDMTPQAVAVKVKMMQTVAEELGQWPGKLGEGLNVIPVRHVLEGVVVSELT